MKKINLLMNSACGLLLTGVIAAPVAVNTIGVMATPLSSYAYTTLAPSFTSDASSYNTDYIDIFQIQDWDEKTAISYRNTHDVLDLGWHVEEYRDVWYGFQQEETLTNCKLGEPNNMDCKYDESTHLNNQNLLFIRFKADCFTSQSKDDKSIEIVGAEVTAHDYYGECYNSTNLIEFGDSHINDMNSNCRDYYDESTGYYYYGLELVGSNAIYTTKAEFGWLNFFMPAYFYSWEECKYASPDQYIDYDEYAGIYLDFSFCVKYPTYYGAYGYTHFYIDNIYVKTNENHNRIGFCINN